MHRSKSADFYSSCAMSNLAKAGIFASAAFLSCVFGVVSDMRQLRRKEEANFLLPLALFSNAFVCAGVGILLFGDYLLTPQ
ncbi:MAG: hypothetical protein WB676_20705 [Bryobacteraceae bacterium]